MCHKCQWFSYKQCLAAWQQLSSQTSAMAQRMNMHTLQSLFSNLISCNSKITACLHQRWWWWWQQWRRVRLHQWQLIKQFHYSFSIWNIDTQTQNEMRCCLLALVNVDDGCACICLLKNVNFCSYIFRWVSSTTKNCVALIWLASSDNDCIKNGKQGNFKQTLLAVMSQMHTHMHGTKSK